MMDYTALREISIKFRRLSSNMLRSDFDDNNIHVIRLKKYIEETPTIKEYIIEEIRSSSYDIPLVRESSHTGWLEVTKPISESDHIKAMFDFLVEVSKPGYQLNNLALTFPGKIRSLNDSMQVFVSKTLKPLIDFINEKLSSDLIRQKEDTSYYTHISQHIEHNSGTVNATNSGNIQSITGTKKSQEVLNLIDSITELLGSSELSSREEIEDDLEILSEQIQSNQPKKKRVKNSIARIRDSLEKVPKDIKNATLLISNGNRLIELVSELIL